MFFVFSRASKMTFNSLFEMRIVSEGEGRVGYRYTFNSLFEMPNCAEC